MTSESETTLEKWGDVLKRWRKSRIMCLDCMDRMQEADLENYDLMLCSKCAEFCPIPKREPGPSMTYV